MDWQPIETAPEDGTRILLWDGDRVLSGRREFDQWWPDLEWNVEDGLPMDTLGMPTHWMPLPEPPSK